MNSFTFILFRVIDIVSHSIGFIALASVFAVCSTANNYSPLVWTLLFFLIGIAVLFAIFFKNHTSLKNAFKLFMVVFCISVVISVFIYYYYLHLYDAPYEDGGTDDKEFEDLAYDIIKLQPDSVSEFQEIIRNLRGGTWNIAQNYVLVVAFIHKATLKLGLPPHTLNPRLFNSLCLGLISIFVWQLALMIRCSGTNSLLAGYLCGLNPIMIFESAHIYRDTIISLGIVIAAFALISLFQSRKGKYLLVFLLAAMFPSLLRTHLLYVFFLIVTFALLLSDRSTRLKVLIISSIFIAIVLYQFIFPSYLEIPQYYETYSRLRTSQGSEGGFGQAVFSLPPVMSVPIRIVYANFAPVPFPSSSLVENFRRLGTIFWILSLPFLLGSLWKAVLAGNNKIAFPLRITSTSFMIIFLTVSIFTFQTRQYLMFIPLGIPLILYGVENSRKTWVVSIIKVSLFVISVFMLYICYRILS
jgi:hypothetical protein